jgi:hypothetical protein
VSTSYLLIRAKVVNYYNWRVTKIICEKRHPKCAHKPKDNVLEWKDEPELNAALTQDLANLHTLAEQSKPKIIFTFGAFAFEFARRAIEGTNDPHVYVLSLIISVHPHFP